MKLLAENFSDAFPADTNGRPLAELPLMQRIAGAQEAKLAVSVATGIIGEWWANLINAQFGLPVAVGCTAVSAPKYYAYLEAGQMIGLIGGLKGASEYEKLLKDNYPQTREAYANPLLQTASKGMDAQTIDHVIVIVFIVIGNIAYFWDAAPGRAPAEPGCRGGEVDASLPTDRNLGGGAPHALPDELPLPGQSDSSASRRLSSPGSRSATTSASRSTRRCARTWSSP